MIMGARSFSIILVAFLASSSLCAPLSRDQDHNLKTIVVGLPNHSNSNDTTPSQTLTEMTKRINTSKIDERANWYGNMNSSSEEMSQPALHRQNVQTLDTFLLDPMENAHPVVSLTRNKRDAGENDIERDDEVIVKNRKCKYNLMSKRCTCWEGEGWKDVTDRTTHAWYKETFLKCARCNNYVDYEVKQNENGEPYCTGIFD